MSPAAYSADPVYPDQAWTDPVGIDQVDLRPLLYEPLRPSALKLSLIAAGVALLASMTIISSSLARLPDIDPMADAGLVVDYAAQPRADRGLLMVAPVSKSDMPPPW